MMSNHSKRPRNRFNSFELSDSEQQSQSNLKSMILDLQCFFPAISTFDSMEIDRTINDSVVEDDEDFPLIPLYDERFVKYARKDMRCLEALKGIRSSMDEMQKHSEVTNWDLLMKDGFKVHCKYRNFMFLQLKDLIN